jgi:DNA invertase Pin-like site-specific DNA recombinase
MPNMRNAALYLFVGTLDGSAADQEHDLREVANRMGYQIVKVYRDDGASGTKSQKHPKLEKLCLDAYNRKFELVLAWSVERLGYSLHDLVGFLSEMHALKIDLYLHKQGVDTTTPAGRAMFDVVSVFTEFERAVVRERFRSARAKAKQAGKKITRSVDPAVENEIRDALARGDAGMIKIANRFGVGTGTVQRIKAEMTSKNAAPVSC